MNLHDTYISATIIDQSEMKMNFDMQTGAASRR